MGKPIVPVTAEETAAELISRGYRKVEEEPEPHIPTEPHVPTEPHIPGEPAEPHVPSEPDVPSEPYVPSEPDIPLEPHIPSIPDMPGPHVPGHHEPVMEDGRGKLIAGAVYGVFCLFIDEKHILELY